MILHLIKQSGLTDRLANICFASVNVDDAIVFTEANTDFFRGTPLAKQLVELSKTNPLYLLDIDGLFEKSDGFPYFLKQITMEEFVNLTARFPKSQSWF